MDSVTNSQPTNHWTPFKGRMSFGMNENGSLYGRSIVIFTVAAGTPVSVTAGSNTRLTNSPIKYLVPRRRINSWQHWGVALISPDELQTGQDVRYELTPHGNDLYALRNDHHVQKTFVLKRSRQQWEEMEKHDRPRYYGLGIRTRVNLTDADIDALGMCSTRWKLLAIIRGVLMLFISVSCK